MNPERLPREMGPYRLLSRLGAGGMGTVYRAEDTQLGREVAIKVLHPHLLGNHELKARFAREARLHASINHPNIVTLYNLHEENGELALVMEMVHGRNLKEYLRTTRNLTLERLLDIARDILRGLAAAHEQGMVHRDLKPANILISDEGQVKIMDFGLAKQSDANDDLTQSGAVVGSYRYMAPEQIMHEAIDARTDLYAFGIVLFQMLTGSLPFDSNGQGGEFEIMEQQVRSDPPPPRELNPAIPQPLHELLLRLLAKKPEDRPRDCATVIEEIERILHDSEDAQAPMPRPRDARETSSAIDIASGLIQAVGHGARAHWRHHVPAPLRRALPLLLVVPVLWWFFSGEDATRQATNAVPQQQSATHLPQTTTTAAIEERHDEPPAPKPDTPLPTQQTASPPKEKQASAPPPAKKKSLAKADPSPRRAERSSLVALPLHQKYRLLRSDFTRAKPGEDEFTGGHHRFFEELADYPLKKRLHTFKTGYTRLTFQRPQQVRRIIVHRASVHGADFTSGYIRLWVRRDEGRWQRLLDRQNEDISQPQRIDVPAKFNPVKEVKLTFKTPEPLEVRDIRILGKTPAS